jgi:hypothetical protein
VLGGLVDLQLASSNRAQDDSRSCGRIGLCAVERLVRCKADVRCLEMALSFVLRLNVEISLDAELLIAH